MKAGLPRRAARFPFACLGIMAFPHRTPSIMRQERGDVKKIFLRNASGFDQEAVLVALRDFTKPPFQMVGRLGPEIRRHLLKKILQVLPDNLDLSDAPLAAGRHVVKFLRFFFDFQLEKGRDAALVNQLGGRERRQAVLSGLPACRAVRTEVCFPPNADLLNDPGTFAVKRPIVPASPFPRGPVTHSESPAKCP